MFEPCSPLIMPTFPLETNDKSTRAVFGDYIGVFASLQEALREYSPSDRDQAGVPIEELVAAMLEKHDIVRANGLLRPSP